MRIRITVITHKFQIMQKINLIPICIIDRFIYCKQICDFLLLYLCCGAIVLPNFLPFGLFVFCMNYINKSFYH